MKISYDEYLDRILGGWIGKFLGGSIGARFEGCKKWIELGPDELLPNEWPPNDDLDLQLLWLKVLEERGPNLRSEDMADAWLEWCWYPFNEYGRFRRNWRLGIHPPYSGTFDNELWESGMGCPIRSEIWGYVFPGAPDLAARYARMDGTLDHGIESVSAEMLLAAMAAMAFFEHDIRRLIQLNVHYLAPGTTLARLIQAALDSRDQGLTLRMARERILALGANPEACDARANVPFMFLGLLYGENDLEKTLRAALACGYDTDCTLATAGAFIGQAIGAKTISEHFKKAIGDKFVSGIKYQRPRMTLSALAEDTARVGILLSRHLETGVSVLDPPKLIGFPHTALQPPNPIQVDYEGIPAIAPGDIAYVQVRTEMAGEIELHPSQPGFAVLPDSSQSLARRECVRFAIHLDKNQQVLPWRNIFKVRLNTDAGGQFEYDFGLAGGQLWKFLGVYFDIPERPQQPHPSNSRWMQHHSVSLDHAYIDETEVDVNPYFEYWSKLLDRPAVIAANTERIHPETLIGLQGEYCVYLARTILSPDARDVFLAIGNNDGYRIYLNQELVGEMDEHTCYAPFNAHFRVHLRSGENLVLLKCLKQDAQFEFSFGIRSVEGTSFNATDWIVDLADKNPYRSW